MGKENKKPNWIIHSILNGTPCSCCGKIEYPFIDGIGDSHTHGMNKYGHPEFQMVLSDVYGNYPPEVIAYVLNTLGQSVRNGARYHPGSFVQGIFLDCPIRLDKRVEGGEELLRVVIPDRFNRWPEDMACEYPYNQQCKSLNELRNPNYTH